MLTKGIITEIDYNESTCIVRIPFFENAGNPQIMTAKATLSIVPGIYNGYKVNDVVYVTFENNELTSPVVIGKLYIGTDAEQQAVGAINCNDIYVKNLTLPLTTKIQSDNTLKNTIDGGAADYKTIGDIINKLQELANKVDNL